jgi:hypothetical protein
VSETANVLWSGDVPLVLVDEDAQGGLLGQSEPGIRCQTDEQVCVE